MGPSLSILIVDDHAEVRELLHMVVEMCGYTAHEAADGREALRWLEQARATGMLPSLVLLDLAMPDMDGLTFRAAQRRDPQLAAIPVIVISAEHDGAKKAAAMDVAAFLQKPLAIKVLMAEIARIQGQGTKSSSVSAL